MSFSPSDEESLALSYDVKYFRFANNIITKMFDFDARVLIGCLAYTLASHPIRTRASKSDCCFYVKVACLSYGEYSSGFYLS